MTYEDTKIEVGEPDNVAETSKAQANGDEADVRMGEIEEILGHTAMPILDQCALYAEWVRHAEAKASVLGQNVSKPRGGRPKGGIARAAHELPIRAKNEKAREKFIRRAIDIDSIWPEAKAAARAAGLDDIQSALLAIASEKSSPQAQLEKVQELAERKVAPQRKRNKANPLASNDSSESTHVNFDFSEVGTANQPLTVEERALLTVLEKAWNDDGVLWRTDWEKSPERVQCRFATGFLGLGRTPPGGIKENLLPSSELGSVLRIAEEGAPQVKDEGDLSRGPQAEEVAQ